MTPAKDRNLRLLAKKTLSLVGSSEPTLEMAAEVDRRLSRGTLGRAPLDWEHNERYVNLLKARRVLLGVFEILSPPDYEGDLTDLRKNLPPEGAALLQRRWSRLIHLVAGAASQSATSGTSSPTSASNTSEER